MILTASFCIVTVCYMFFLGITISWPSIELALQFKKSYCLRALLFGEYMVSVFRLIKWLVFVQNGKIVNVSSCLNYNYNLLMEMSV